MWTLPLGGDDIKHAAVESAAHEKAIFHRDLNPANIMVTPAGVVKVPDCGLAAHTRDTPPANTESCPRLTISATQASAGERIGSQHHTRQVVVVGI